MHALCACSQRSPLSLGFENFVPKGLLSAKAKPKPASSAKKAAEQSSSAGGSGNSSGRPLTHIGQAGLASMCWRIECACMSPGGGNNNEVKIEIGAPLQWLGLGLVAFYLWSNLVNSSTSGRQVHEISFQEFKTKLLGQVRCIRSWWDSQSNRNATRSPLSPL